MVDILVVDDDFDDLSVMKSALTKAGYNVEGATNQIQALDKLEGGPFDLILIDINLMGCKGNYLASKIRQSYDRKIKLAYVSTVSEKDVDMKDVNAFIQKPLEEEIFLKKVKAILKG